MTSLFLGRVDILSLKRDGISLTSKRFKMYLIVGTSMNWEKSLTGALLTCEKPSHLPNVNFNVNSELFLII
jgi:hypothetical protein